MIKKVVFLCLLSLAATISITAADDQKPSPPQPAVTQNVADSNLPKAATDSKENVTQSLDSNATTGNDTLVTDSNKNETALNGTTAEPTPAKSDEKKPDPSKATVVPAKKQNETETIPSNSTNTTGNTTKPTTTSSSTTSTSTTTSTTSTTTVKPTPAPHVKIEQGRAFDGPSFIGGIVLTLGLIAIGFMGFKYYKTRTERNYHTL